MGMHGTAKIHICMRIRAVRSICLLPAYRILTTAKYIGVDSTVSPADLDLYCSHMDRWLRKRTLEHIRIAKSKSACVSAMSGQYICCSSTQYRDPVKDIGLIAKMMTRRMAA